LIIYLPKKQPIGGSTMQGTVTKKIPGGKLIRVDITYGRRIEKAVITGDFFIHPEETLLDIENCLVGVQVPINAEQIAGRIQDAIGRQNAEVVGFTPADLAAVLMEAVS
jgi:lipoate---protein ligase